ncbi:hypothetical protein C8J57DRAFT_1597803 [Mycena rebaudengoi]|nr:hypothetical protein C8J57DRAFT_1597803 [Mycena rebaudengoi]
MADKKTILVTGCSGGGIGAAMALALANYGHDVFATARNTSKIPGTLSSYSGPGRVTILQLDVTSGESIKVAHTAVAASGKGLDVLVNNAGSGYTMPLLDVDLDQAVRVHDTNLLIPNRGRIVNVSSVGAVVNTPWIGVYSTSKAALTSLSDTMRLEFSPFGVSVITIMVGVVTTPFHANEPQLVLPPTSRYAAIKDTISRWATGQAGPKGGSPEELAESLINDIVGLAKTSGQVWKGAYAGTIKIASRWVPTSMLDGMMAKDQGLDELAKSLQK